MCQAGAGRGGGHGPTAAHPAGADLWRLAGGPFSITCCLLEPGLTSLVPAYSAELISQGALTMVVRSNMCVMLEQVILKAIRPPVNILK